METYQGANKAMLDDYSASTGAYHTRGKERRMLYFELDVSTLYSSSGVVILCADYPISMASSEHIGSEYYL